MVFIGVNKKYDNYHEMKGKERWEFYSITQLVVFPEHKQGRNIWRFIVYTCDAGRCRFFVVLRCLSESCDWLAKRDGVYEMINSLDGSAMMNDYLVWSFFTLVTLLKYEITGLLPSERSELTIFKNHSKCRIWILEFFTNFCFFRAH